jgi:hypothetical protein
MRRASLLSTLLLLAPGTALACAVCAGGNPANRFAFFASTIVLSLLPLGMFAAAFLWLRARLRARGSDEFVERDAVTPESRPRLLEAPPTAPGEPHPTAPPAR